MRTHVIILAAEKYAKLFNEFILCTQRRMFMSLHICIICITICFVRQDSNGLNYLIVRVLKINPRQFNRF